MPATAIEIDSTHLDAPGPLAPPIDPYAMESGAARQSGRETDTTAEVQPVRFHPRREER